MAMARSRIKAKAKRKTKAKAKRKTKAKTKRKTKAKAKQKTKAKAKRKDEESTERQVSRLSGKHLMPFDELPKASWKATSVSIQRRILMNSASR